MVVFILFYSMILVYGVARPGEILALMGARYEVRGVLIHLYILFSGAGKTTLLNVLTQRNMNGVEMTGIIRINGNVVKKHLIRKLSAYVQQEDLFIGSMTVIEHLRFMVHR